MNGPNLRKADSYQFLVNLSHSFLEDAAWIFTTLTIP